MGRNSAATLIGEPAEQMAKLIENHRGVALVAPSMRRGLQRALIVSVVPISTEALLAHGFAPDMEPTPQDGASRL
jgi:hypothetical protein